jgi:hypothetical protein
VKAESQTSVSLVAESPGWEMVAKVMKVVLSCSATKAIHVLKAAIVAEHKSGYSTGQAILRPK